MLTALDKLLLGLWLLPVVLGLVVGVRVGDDEGRVMLFVTGIVAVLYVVVLTVTVCCARRRRRWAELAPTGEAEPDRVGSPVEHGTARRASRALPRVLVVPAAVYLVVAEGSWTFVVVALQLVTVVTMAAHVHVRHTEPEPAV